MSEEIDPEVRMTARKILIYLAAHSEAQDTVEGVVQWWLQRDVRKRTCVVQKALDLLVDQGRLISTPTPATPEPAQADSARSRQLYRLNPARLDEVKALLEGGTS